RERNRARGQLFPRSRRSRDQRGEIAHACVERTPITAHVVGENRLPYRSAQTSGGKRAADDVAKDLFESALDLAKAGERVSRLVPRRKRDAFHGEEMVPIGDEILVKLPAMGAAPVRRPESYFVKAPIVSLV